MAMVQTAVETETRRTGDEVERLGEEIYERDIRAQVEADHQDEYVIIDVESGCWAVAADSNDVLERLHAAQPEAHDLFRMRVGHATATYVGYSPPRQAE